MTSDETAPTWSFLTNHAAVLLCIAHDPGIRLRDIGDAVSVVRVPSFGLPLERLSDLRKSHWNLQSVDAQL